MDPEKTAATSPDRSPSPSGPPTGRPSSPKDSRRPTGAASSGLSRPRSSSSALTVPLSPLREATFVAVACSTQLLLQAGFGNVLIPSHLIGSALGVSSPGVLSWFLASYSLTVGTFILVAGRLGDTHGHKRLLVAGWVWFALWTTIAGLAAIPHSPIFFIVARALQGIGPAAALPASLALLGRTYVPGRKKEMIFAAFGSTAPIGAVLGNLVGSAFAQFGWWPWAQWVHAIVCAILGVLAAIAAPPDPPASSRRNVGFDAWGAALGVSGLILFNIAWNQAPLVGWQTPYVIVLLLLGLIALTAFFLYEWRAEHPLFPPGILDARAVSIIVCIALGWASFSVWIYYVVQLLVVLRGEGPITAATKTIPVVVSGATAAFVTGHLLSRVHLSWMMVASMIAFLVGNLLVATAPTGQIYWANIFVTFIVTPWG